MAKAQTKGIEIPAITIGRATIRVEGTTDLIVHKFAEKARREMLDKQQLKATKKKEAKNPAADYRGAMYILDGDPEDDQSDEDVWEPIGSAKCSAKHGFPAAALRLAMIRGVKACGGVMTDARTAFNIEAVDNLVPIEFEGVRCVEDVVRLNGKSADLRHRPYYSGWSATLPVMFNASLMSIDQIVNVLRLAGMSVGVGEWRPEKNGSFGTFVIDPESLKTVSYEEL